MQNRPRPVDARATGTVRRVGRPPGPTAQGAASREVIVEAATTVFARLGYDRARMTDIVEASGLSKGSVYFHFDSKESLAAAVLEARQTRWLADVEALVAGVAPGEPRLRRLLPAMLELHRADPDAWVISRLTQSLASVEATRAFAAAMTGRWVELVAALVREARRAEDVDPDAVTVATVMVGAFDGLKMTVDVTCGGDRDAAQRALAAGGAVLEGMLLAAVGARSVDAPSRHGGDASVET